VAAVPFHEKKAKTSFMRRFAPDGVATSLMATINIRAIRWIIQQRTEPGAEEEIRLVMDQVAQIMQSEAPALLQDFERQENGAWVPSYRKV
jgi:thymidylate synthase (FAD)